MLKANYYRQSMPKKHTMHHAVTEQPPSPLARRRRAVFADTKEVTPSGCIRDARLWETPYKHVVRHAVTR